MTQGVIINHLIQYAQWDNPELTSHDNAQQLLKKGLCYGFSLCYAVMWHLGYQDWWEQVLIAIHNWDGNIQNIDQQVTINGHTYQMRQLLQRVFAYTIFHQTFPAVYDAHQEVDQSPISTAFYPNLSQITILDKDNDYLQALDSTNNKLTTQSAKTFAGSFKLIDLINILKPELVKKRLCLVSNFSHCVSITYDEADGYWRLYDPNFSHHDQHLIKSYYANSLDLAYDLTNMLGQTLAFKLADFDNNPIELPWYEDQLLRTPLNILGGDGMVILLQESPYHVNMLLNHLPRDILFTLLNTNISQSEMANWNLLHYAVYNQPVHCLKALLRHLEGQRLHHMLLAKGMNGYRPIDLLVKHQDTEVLQVLLNCIWPYTWQTILASPASSNMDPMFHRIARYHFPRGLAWTLNYMADWSWECFTDMLYSKDLNSMKVLDYSYNPAQAKTFYHMLDESAWYQLLRLGVDHNLVDAILQQLNQVELQKTMALFDPISARFSSDYKYIKRLWKQKNDELGLTDQEIEQALEQLSANQQEQTSNTEFEQLLTVQNSEALTPYSFFKRKRGYHNANEYPNTDCNELARVRKMRK